MGRNAPKPRRGLGKAVREQGYVPRSRPLLNRATPPGRETCPSGPAGGVAIADNRPRHQRGQLGVAHPLDLTQANRRRPCSRWAVDARRQAPGLGSKGGGFLLISLGTVDAPRPTYPAISPMYLPWERGATMSSHPSGPRCL